MAPSLRSLSATAAVQLAMQEAERLEMRLKAEHFGQQKYPMIISHLMRGDTKVDFGYGRGEGLEGVVSAHFEALERYFTSARINRRFSSGAASLKNAKDIARQRDLAGDLVIQRWADDFPESMAACVVYNNTTSSVWYPIFLNDPYYHYDPLPGDTLESYRSIIRYSSSLGTASGSNAREAHLHGLCELIEHDAVSHALLRWFVARLPRFDIVDINSFPDRVRLLYDAALEAVGSEVILFDVTTDIGIPAYLAVKDDCVGEIRPSGAGASPIGDSAAAMALSELIQVAALIDDAVISRIKAHLAKWPILQECFMVSPRIRSSQDVKRVPLRGSVGDPSTVESSLATVTSLLRHHGIYSYTCELAPPESLISVVSTIAPGLERFSLVRMGLPVVPTGRGWNVWAAARSNMA